MKTRIYDQPPPQSGVVFKGLEGVKIESRSDFQEKIEKHLDYCSSDAKTSTIFFIKGEWGEGKSDAYERIVKSFCENSGMSCYLTKGVSIANAFNVLTTNLDSFRDGSLENGKRFLFVIFYTLFDAFFKSEKNLFQDQPFEVALHNALLKIIKNKRAFIFIDEFEELLTEKYRKNLPEIISGLKEILNGEYLEIHENGEYEGSIHFFIAITPAAYYLLQTDKNFAEIKGGLGRRSRIVELKPISELESLIFLEKLVQYSYNYKIPEPYPFKNFGIFRAISRISLRNLGNMVKIFTTILTHAKGTKNDYIDVIDEEIFLYSITNENVSIYGGETHCIDDFNFNRIFKLYLKGKPVLQKVLKYFLTNLNPISISELTNSLSLENKTEIPELINELNEILSKSGKIEAGIIYVKKLHTNFNYDLLRKVFEDKLIEIGGIKHIKFGSYDEEWQNFVEKLSYYELEGKEVSHKFFLPEMEFVENYFENMFKVDFKIVNDHLTDYQNNDEIFYILNPTILDQIYPTPIPPELEFFKDREQKIKIWRNINKNLFEIYQQKGLPTLVFLLQSANIINSVKDIELNENYGVFNLVLTEKNCEAKTFLKGIRGDLLPNHIEELNKIELNYNNEHNSINLFLIFFDGEFTKEAQELQNKMDLGSRILTIPISQQILKKIIFVYEVQDFEQTENAPMLHTLKILTRDQLGLDAALNVWFEIQGKCGNIITDLTIKNAKEFNSLINALKYFINFCDHHEDSKKIFDLNDELLNKLILYGSKTIISPDIEYPQFNKLCEDLINNGFLEIRNNKYFIRTHIIEQRISEILKRLPDLVAQEIQNFFIFTTKNRDAIFSIFIEILEFKGIIEKDKKKRYSIRVLGNQIEKINELFNNFKRDNAGFLKNQNFYHIFNQKKRDSRLISLKNYYQILTNLINDIHDKRTSITDKFAKCNLSDLIQIYYNDKIQPIFYQIQQIFDTLKEIDGIDLSIKENIQAIQKDLLKQLKIVVDFTVDLDNLSLKYEEFQSLKQNMNDINIIEKLEEKIVEDYKKQPDDSPFFFSKGPRETQDYCSNLVLYDFNKKREELLKIKTTIEQEVKPIKDTWNSLNGDLVRFQEGIKVLEVPEDLKISFSLLIILKNNSNFNFENFEFSKNLPLIKLKAQIQTKFLEIQPLISNFFHTYMLLKDEIIPIEKQIIKLVIDIPQNIEKLKNLDLELNLSKENDLINEIRQELEERVNYINEFKDYGKLTLLGNNTLVELNSFLKKIKKIDEKYLIDKITKIFGSNISSLHTNIQSIKEPKMYHNFNDKLKIVQKQIDNLTLSNISQERIRKINESIENLEAEIELYLTPKKIDPIKKIREYFLTNHLNGFYNNSELKQHLFNCGFKKDEELRIIIEKLKEKKILKSYLHLEFEK